MTQRKGQENSQPAGRDAAVISLAEAESDRDLQLVEIRGGRGIRHRLAEMGFAPGVLFRVIRQGRPGPLVVLLKGSRLVIGWHMAERMFVKAK